jgi:pimeloyl-ACP methyl ester carboxylesterase
VVGAANTIARPQPMSLQGAWDRVPVDGAIEGAGVDSLPRARGGAVRYVDTGEAGWTPIVFFGGLGTSVSACSLTEFARTSRRRLRLRLISVERNGFGGTPYDPSAGYAEAVADVLGVLDAIAVERFAIVAISGGGPYAAALAARVPERVISLHLAAAAAGALIASCGRACELFSDCAGIARDPAAMWEFPAGSHVHRIPGFTEAAAAEGRRALGHEDGADALAHELRLLCETPLPDLRSVLAPAYLYWGSDDDVVPLAHSDAWSRSLSRGGVLRRYEGEGHDVQYRHWNQILIDAAGLGGCERGLPT